MKTYDIIIITTYLLYTRNGRFFSIALYTRLYQIKKKLQLFRFQITREERDDSYLCLLWAFLVSERR